MIQLQLEINVHQRENNIVSEAWLEANKGLFSESCLSVLKALVAGIELTTDNAKELAGTRSLPRRILDLRQNNGISISSEWILNEQGKRTVMKYYMTAEDKAKSLSVLLNKMKNAA